MYSCIVFNYILYIFTVYLNLFSVSYIDKLLYLLGVAGFDNSHEFILFLIIIVAVGELAVIPTLQSHLFLKSCFLLVCCPCILHHFGFYIDLFFTSFLKIKTVFGFWWICLRVLQANNPYTCSLFSPSLSKFLSSSPTNCTHFSNHCVYNILNTITSAL